MRLLIGLLTAGLITAGEIACAVPQYREIYEAAETQFPGATARERFNEGLRHLVDLLVSGLIEGTVTAAREAAVEDFEAVRAHPIRLAAFTPEAGAASRDLKRFLSAKVYASVALGADRQRSTRAMAELFAFFLADPNRLPDHYVEQAKQEPPHRVVCDYIAGMTDAFFNRTYEHAMSA